MEKKARRQQNFMHGALILVVSTALVKIIGAVFKIPLGWIMGGVGMGYYMTAYDIYAPIYTIAMAGLPIAVSKLVSEAVVEQRFKDVRSLLRVSRKAFFITGLAGFFLIALVAYPYCTYIAKSTGPLYCILVIAPSMLFCCIMSCYRGYYEGMRNMYPTAVSQVIEALGKLIFGFGIAYVILQIGMNQYHETGMVFGQMVIGGEEDARVKALPLASAGAIAGVTLGTLIGAIYLIIRHKRTGDSITAEELAASPDALPDIKNLKILMTFAIPVVLGALAQNIASLIDLMTVQSQLSNIAESSYPELVRSAILAPHADYLNQIHGNTTEDSNVATFLYGCYKGYSYSFYNLVPTLTSILGVSALPNLAAAWYAKDKAGVKTNVESVLRVTSLLAIPAGLGISALSLPILNAFYSKQPVEAAIAADLLFYLAIAGVMAGIAMPVTSMLQGIGKQMVPVWNILIGMGVKIVLNWILVVQPSINILGAAISTVVCYAVILLLNLIALIRYSKVVPSIWKTLGKPLVAGLACALAAWASNGLIARAIGGGGRLATLLPLGCAVLIGGLVFLIVLFALRTITEQDVKMLPKGEKIAKVLAKFRLLG